MVCSYAQSLSQNKSALFLLPEPRIISTTSGVFGVGENLALYCPNEAMDTVEILLKFGLTENKLRKISLQAIPKPNAESCWHLATKNATLPNTPSQPESYVLSINNKGIALASISQDGFRHGLKTLCQIMNQTDNLPFCQIEDYPAFKIRGLMIDMVRLKEKDEVYFRLLEEIAAWKMNALFLHFTDGQGCSIELKSHPEVVTRNPMSQETVKKLISRGMELGVRVIPEIESWGHAQWITNPHPELAEPNTNSLCLSEKSIYRFLDDVIKETAELFPDPYLHIGCDEASIATEPKCKALLEEIGEDNMVSKHINQVNGIVRKYNKRSIIWGDIVLKPNKMLELLDKDIVIEHWEYGNDVTDEKLLYLKKSGFNGLAAPSLMWGGWRICPAMYMFENVGRLSELAHKAELDGVVTTIWLPQRYIPRTIGPGIAYSAQEAWNPGIHPLRHTIAAYLQNRFSLQPTDERIDNILSLSRIGRRESALSSAFWSSLSELFQLSSEECTHEVEKEAKLVNGLEVRLQKDLQEVASNKKDFEFFILTAALAQHLSKRKLAAGKIVSLIKETQQLAGEDKKEEASKRLHAAANIIYELEKECSNLFAQMQEAWDLDRYPTDPERIGEGTNDNLYRWLGNKEVFGYSLCLAEELKKLALNSDLTELDKLLQTR